MIITDIILREREKLYIVKRLSRYLMQTNKEFFFIYQKFFVNL